MCKLKEGPEGSDLVSKNSFFKGHETALFNKRILSFTIDKVI